MKAGLYGARMGLVTEDSSEDMQRGARIRSRRLGLGIKSIRQFSELTKVDRQAVSSAEAGTASVGTYERLEAWLDGKEEETGHDEIEPSVTESGGLVEFEVKGDFGISIIVRGPREDRADLEQSVLRIIRDMRHE